MPTEISSVHNDRTDASFTPAQSNATEHKFENGSRAHAPNPPHFATFNDLKADIKRYIGIMLTDDIQGVKGLRSLVGQSRQDYTVFSPLAAAGTARLIKTMPEHVRAARFDQLLDFLLQDTANYTGPRGIRIDLLHVDRAAGLAGLAVQMPYLRSRRDMTERFNQLLDACKQLPEPRRPEMIVALAGSVGAIAPGARAETFEIMRGLVDELPDALRADGLAALARPLGAIPDLNGQDLNGQTERYDSILAACEDLPEAMRPRVHVALAGSVAAVAPRFQADRFRAMLDLLRQQPDAQHAEGLAALAGQLSELDTLPDSTARFNAVLDDCRQLPTEHQPAVLIALAGTVSTLAIVDQPDSFNTMFELVNGLPDAGRAEGLAALGKQLVNQRQLPDERARFDCILNACRNLDPPHKGVALAGLAAGISSLSLGEAADAFQTILEGLDKVSEPAVRARGLIALARQVRLGSTVYWDKAPIGRFHDILEASASLSGKHRVPVLEALAGVLMAVPDHDETDGARGDAFDAVLDATKAAPADCRAGALMALTSRLGLLQPGTKQMDRFEHILSALEGIGSLETSLVLAALAHASGNLLASASDYDTAIDRVLGAAEGLATNQRGPVLAALARQRRLSSTQYVAVLEGSRGLPTQRERAQVLISLGNSLGWAAPSLVDSAEHLNEAVRGLIEQTGQLNDPQVRQRVLEGVARSLTRLTHSEPAFSAVLLACEELLPPELRPAVVEVLAPRASSLGQDGYAKLLESIDAFDDECKTIILPELADSIQHCRNQTAALAAFDDVMDRSTRLPERLRDTAIQKLADALRHLPPEKMLERFRTLVEGNRDQVRQDTMLRVSLRGASESMESLSRSQARSILDSAQA